MDVIIRKFTFDDIPNKVKWINDSSNNKYLHYDLPLEVDKTEIWFRNNEHSLNRYDAIIEVDQEPVGLIGLLNIDGFKAEYYITLGESNYRGKNVAKIASDLLLEYGFNEIGLEKIYLYTEQGNIAMQKLAIKIGMFQETILTDHLIREGETRNCFYYTLTKRDYLLDIKLPEENLSDIEYLYKDNQSNEIYMKREDLIAFSLGGNKARKAKYFFNEILKSDYSMVVTYGSKSSNHCRVVSNLCAKHNLKCIVISPISDEKSNYNRDLISLTNTRIIECKLEEVSQVIEKTIRTKNHEGEKVYFIPGGGHGNNGTQAYVDAYSEIEHWERKKKKQFDYIFLASGTGATQAGLVVGQIINKKFNSKIIGISVARGKEIGEKVILESITGYFRSKGYTLDDSLTKYINFTDEFTHGGYGKYSSKVLEEIKKMYIKTGIPLSLTYTGKAYSGMNEYIKDNNIANKSILFINTGGLPLFFNDLDYIKQISIES